MAVAEHSIGGRAAGAYAEEQEAAAAGQRAGRVGGIGDLLALIAAEVAAAAVAAASGSAGRVEQQPVQLQLPPLLAIIDEIGQIEQCRRCQRRLHAPVAARAQPPCQMGAQRRWPSRPRPALHFFCVLAREHTPQPPTTPSLWAGLVRCLLQAPPGRGLGAQTAMVPPLQQQRLGPRQTAHAAGRRGARPLPQQLPVRALWAAWSRRRPRQRLVPHQRRRARQDHHPRPQLPRTSSWPRTAPPAAASSGSTRAAAAARIRWLCVLRRPPQPLPHPGPRPHTERRQQAQRRRPLLRWCRQHPYRRRSPA